MKTPRPNRYPHLERATARGRELIEGQRQDWARVMKLRAVGQEKSAARLVRRLLGVKSRPMPEEVKQLLRSRKVQS